MHQRGGLDVSRRQLLVTSAASVAVTSIPAAGEAREMSELTPVRHTVSVTVNGQPHQLEIDTRTTLLDALRDHLHLTGTKRLRPRPMRSLHRYRRWTPYELMPELCSHA